jgi:hypothetical protein
MANKWLTKLQKFDNVVKEHTNPFNGGVHTASPSVDFIYGNGTWLLPFGYSEVLYGPPKGGKSVVVKMKIGQLHKDDPEAMAVVFDTEFRWEGQLTAAQAEMYGIDMERLVIFKGNSPMLVFDRIEKDLADMIQDGMPLRYIAIDSVSSVLGRRELDSDTVETQQIGDHALTIQTGLKRILPTIRNNKIAVSLVTQVRAEMDQATLRRDPSMKVKMNASFGLQHFAEYFVYVTPNLNKEGRTDMQGNEMVNTNVKDLMDKGEKLGHKIRVIMKDSSMGPKGRTGEFSFDYKRGLINVHEEVFRLGKGYGIINSETKGWYEFGGKKWHGEKDMLKALEENPGLQAEVIRELRARDLRGDFNTLDAKAAEAAEESK